MEWITAERQKVPILKHLCLFLHPFLLQQGVDCLSLYSSIKNFLPDPQRRWEIQLVFLSVSIASFLKKSPWDLAFNRLFLQIHGHIWDHLCHFLCWSQRIEFLTLKLVVWDFCLAITQSECSHWHACLTVLWNVLHFWLKQIAHNQNENNNYYY